MRSVRVGQPEQFSPEDRRDKLAPYIIKLGAARTTSTALTQPAKRFGKNACRIARARLIHHSFHLSISRPGPPAPLTSPITLHFNIDVWAFRSQAGCNLAVCWRTDASNFWLNMSPGLGSPRR
jgi:hypothetical protein